MHKARIISCAIIAILAIGAGVVSTASAASWKVNGALLAGSAALSTTAEVKEASKLTFSTVTVECTGATLGAAAPQITHPDSASAGSITASGCKVAAGSSCELPGSTFSTVPVTALAQTVGTTVLMVVRPKTKTVLATLEFTGASCPFASEVQPVTGTILETAPKGGTENTFQEIKANTPSGEVKVGSSAGTISLWIIWWLLSRLPWSYR